LREAERKKENHLQRFPRVLDLDGRGLGHRGTLGRLLLGALHLRVGEVVHGGELDEGGEDEGEADGDEPVHGGGVGDLGKGVAGADAERRHGEDRGDAFDGNRKKQRNAKHMSDSGHTICAASQNIMI